MGGSWVAILLLGLAVSSAGAEFSLGKSYRPLKGRAPSLDVVTDNVVPLVPVNRAQRHYKGLHRRQSASNGNFTAISNPNQVNYVAQVGWGNETYSMMLDTGSSDTWILQKGFQCLDSTGVPTNVRVFSSLCFVKWFLICHTAKQLPCWTSIYWKFYWWSDQECEFSYQLRFRNCGWKAWLGRHNYCQYYGQGRRGGNC